MKHTLRFSFRSMFSTLILGLTLAGVGVGGCGRGFGHVDRGPDAGENGGENDGGVEEADGGGDAGGNVDPVVERILFIRHNDVPSPRGLYAADPATHEIFALTPELGELAEVRAYRAGAKGAVCRVSLEYPDMEYHMARLDGSSVKTYPHGESWTRPADLGLTDDGSTAWVFNGEALSLVDLESGDERKLYPGALWAVAPSGRWGVADPPDAPQGTLHILSLEDGTFSNDLGLLTPGHCFYNWTFDMDRREVYANLSSGTLYALDLDGTGARSLTDLCGVSGSPLGLVASSGALVVRDEHGVVALDPASGEVRVDVEFDGWADVAGLSADGRWFVAVDHSLEPETDPGGRLNIVDMISGTSRVLSIAEYLHRPWNCCCGGGSVANPVFAPERGLLALAIQYQPGLCACLCDDPTPYDEDQVILLVDLSSGTLLRVLDHNGGCIPVFSPEETGLAFCHNEDQTSPWMMESPTSGIWIHNIAENTSEVLTDPEGHDTDLTWVQQSGVQ